MQLQQFIEIAIFLPLKPNRGCCLIYQYFLQLQRIVAIAIFYRKSQNEDSVSNFENFFFPAGLPAIERMMWIGATDIEVEGTYVWHDGSPFNFNFWRSDEPDNIGENQHCVADRMG